MPTLNAKRQVRYSQADLNAIEGAMNILSFMNEFAGSGPDFAAVKAGLGRVLDYMKQQRDGKSGDKPTIAKTA